MTAVRTGGKVAVMGSGSWGTAFALVLSDAGNQVALWARRPELAATALERAVRQSGSSWSALTASTTSAAPSGADRSR